MFSLCTAAFGGGGDANDNNYNYNYGQNEFYVGPYCVNNRYIFLGAFYDATCTYQADAATFQALNYGDGFPYFDDPILSGKECLSCLPVDEQMQEQQGNNNDGYNGNQYNQNQYNQYQQNEGNQLCEQSTEAAIKCDSARGYNSGCYFIEKTLPCLDGRGCPQEENQGFDMEQAYQEMAKRLRKNKRAAFMMGALAGALLLGSLSMCLWCYCRPSLLHSSKRNPLLQRRTPLPSKSKVLVDSSTSNPAPAPSVARTQ